MIDTIGARPDPPAIHTTELGEFVLR